MLILSHAMHEDRNYPHLVLQCQMMTWCKPSTCFDGDINFELYVTLYLSLSLAALTEKFEDTARDMEELVARLKEKYRKGKKKGSELCISFIKKSQELIGSIAMHASESAR